MSGDLTSRRHFVAGAAALALGTGARPPGDPPAPDPRLPASGQGQDGITPETIAEAEKLHGVRYTREQRQRLAQSLPAQVAGVRALRQVPRPLALQPALTFDPRLPGVSYPSQANRLVLSPLDPGPLPAAPADIAFASLRAQAAWIGAGQLTSRCLTEIYLERIRRIAPGLLCYITVTEELALRQADEADRELARGARRGLLHGIPYAIKDVFDTAGIPTTWGAEPFRDRVPAADGAVVAALREAGAVLLGKLATGALANGATWFGGTCRNPWNPEEPAGGSSTGSGAAVAAGLCSFAIGTDSLGSILNPADRCGTVGLRATFGRIPTRGAMPLTPSLDRIGPLTRTVEDAAVVLAAIHGPDPSSATSLPYGFAYDAGLDLRRLRVGYSPAWFERVGFGPAASVPASAAHHRALEVLRELGPTLVEVELPPRPYLSLIPNLYVEAAAVFEELSLGGRDDTLPAVDGGGWPDGWRRARLFSAVDYLQGERLRRQIMEDLHLLFERVDVLFAPTYGNFDLLVATNFTGHPGLSLRAGFIQSATRGLGPGPLTPGGVEHTVTQNVAFHGRLFEEGTILTLAAALEARLDVWRRRPPTG